MRLCGIGTLILDRHADYFHDALQPLSSHFRVIFTRTFGSNFLFRLERELRAAVIFVDGLPASFDYDERWQRALNSPEVGKAAKFLIELELDFAMDTSCAERCMVQFNELD